MAFRPLTEAECGQKNPLARLASHITHDHTFSDSHGQVFPSSSDQLVEQFLQETRAIPQTFRMDDLMREMHEIESQRSAIPPIPASAVKDHLHDDAWAQQYIDDGKRFHEVPNNEAIWAEIASEEHNVQHLTDAWSDAILKAEAEGYLLPDEIIEQFEQDDSKVVYSKFMKFMKTEGEGQDDIVLQEGKLTEEEALEWGKEYLSSDVKESSDTVSDKWAEDYTASGPGNEGFNTDMWNTFQKEMSKLDDADSSQSWIDEFSSYYNTGQKDYTFTEDNPMSEIQNPLETGKQFLADDDLPSAVLCFEAAVKKEPENALAWQLLGTTQAENEQDPLAIIALKKCLQIDPQNLPALMALAVSYTNENYYNQACEMLLHWLKFNAKYSDMVPETPNQSMFYGQVTSFLVDAHYKLVQDLFIKAAQRNPQDIDYEVQCGLGVLFNLSGEYNKAADCFTAALSVKPDDARLWNRLGATLANGSRPEEAVDAYHHALNLAPGFIRARYNVGVTCINLRAYKEAAEHFLTALNHQARVKDVTNSGSSSQMSDTIWSALHMCIGFLNKIELKPLVENRDLIGLNKAFGID